MPLRYNRNFFEWLWLYNLEKDSIPVALTCFVITDRPSFSVPHIVIIKPRFGQTLSSFIFLSIILNIAGKYGFADWLNFKFWTAIVCGFLVPPNSSALLFWDIDHPTHSEILLYFLQVLSVFYHNWYIPVYDQLNLDINPGLQSLMKCSKYIWYIEICILKDISWFPSRISIMKHTL